MKYVIKNGAVSINGETILESINLEINEKSHIGIVGKNGAGKTTLLRSIVDNSMLESGIDDTSFQVIKQGNPSIGYLKQIELNDNNTMLEEVRKPFLDIIKMEDRLEYLIKEMNVRDDIKLVLEYTALEEKFKNNGGYSYKKEYEILIKKFGFNDSDKNKYLKEFSGGQKTKIAFIKMLLNKPDILLLDEPTNHLDIVGREYLETILNDYLGTVLFVSHDRYFVSKVATSILALTKDSYKLYNCTYKGYLDKVKLEKDIDADNSYKDNEKKTNVVLMENKKKVNTYNLNKEVSKIEREIKKLEESIKKDEESLYLEEVYSDYDKLNSVNNRINDSKKKLEELNNKWIELMEIQDSN